MKTMASACNNEDFESSPVGQVTSSLGIPGWKMFKLTYPPGVNNCNALSLGQRSSPTTSAIEVFSVSGLIDPKIGTVYPIYSVFGSGVPNAGSGFNPGISQMYGDCFVRINKTNGVALEWYTAEKTITVTATNSLFRFAYISVLKHGSSSCCDAPAVWIDRKSVV